MINKLIKTEEDYSFVLSRIENLMEAEANTPEAEELELLATLVELYEDEHYAMDTPEPIDAIKFRMEQLGLNQQGLVPFIGSKSKVSEILNKKRPLTLSMMRSLHQNLFVDDMDVRNLAGEKQNDIEDEADSLAIESLIPNEAWSNAAAKSNPTKKNVLELAEQLKIHPACIAGRVRFEHNNFRLLSRMVGSGKIRNLFEA